MTIQPDEVHTLSQAVAAEMATAPAKPHELVKRLAELVTFELVKRIQQDRPALLQALTEEARVFIEECRTGKRPKYSFLPTMPEIFAKRLWDSWSEETRRLPEGCGIKVAVWEGLSFLARAQWFVVSADPERVLEPFWDYIIDPLPSGLLLFDKEGNASSSGTLVIAPQAPWRQNYSGMPEELLREQEKQAQQGG